MFILKSLPKKEAGSVHKKLTVNCHSGLDPESITHVSTKTKDSEINSKFRFIIQSDEEKS